MAVGTVELSLYHQVSDLEKLLTSYQHGNWKCQAFCYQWRGIVSCFSICLSDPRTKRFYQCLFEALDFGVWFVDRASRLLDVMRLCLMRMKLPWTLLTLRSRITCFDCLSTLHFPREGKVKTSRDLYLLSGRGSSTVSFIF